MPSIDYYFSLLSPFTYLAGLRLEEIAERHGATVAYKPLNILTLFGETGGTPPAKRHWSRQEYRLQELRRLSEGLALPLNVQPAHWPVDVAAPAAAVIAAQADGQSVGGFVHALLRGVWAEQRDISDAGTIGELAAANGVSLDGLATAMEEAGPVYEANTREAVERGVFGSPFYVVGEERFWGQDRLSWLDRHLAAMAG